MHEFLTTTVSPGNAARVTFDRPPTTKEVLGLIRLLALTAEFMAEDDAPPSPDGTTRATDTRETDNG